MIHQILPREGTKMEAGLRMRTELFSKNIGPTWPAARLPEIWIVLVEQEDESKPASPRPKVASGGNVAHDLICQRGLAGE
jgi:hypothetical protein